MFRAARSRTLFADIEAGARLWPNAPRMFLADGDALVLPVDGLATILDKLAATFPALERVTCYATPINLMHKSVAELRSLRAKKLSLVYVGIESGAATMLNRIRTGASMYKSRRCSGRARSTEGAAVERAAERRLDDPIAAFARRRPLERFVVPQDRMGQHDAITCRLDSSACYSASGRRASSCFDFSSSWRL